MSKAHPAKCKQTLVRDPHDRQSLSSTSADRDKRPFDRSRGSSRRNNTFYIVQSQTRSAPRHGQPPSGSLGAHSCPLQSRDMAEGPRTANPGRWRAAEAPAVPAPTSAVLDGQVISAASGGQGAGSSQNRCRSGPRLSPSRNLGSRHSAFRQAFCSAAAAPGTLAAAIGMPIPCSCLCSLFRSVQQRCCVIVRACPPVLILLMPTPPPLSISTTDRQCLTLRAEAKHSSPLFTASSEVVNRHHAGLFPSSSELSLSWLRRRRAWPSSTVAAICMSDLLLGEWPLPL